MASSRAVTASPGVRRGAPIAVIASQKAPAPRPSATRPLLSRSRLATARARTAGWRNGRLSTFPATVTRSVDAATHDSSVHVSRNAGW